MRDQRTIVFYVTDHFSLFGYAVASEMFRFANEVLDTGLYVTRIVSQSRKPVTSSNGTEIIPTAAFADETGMDAIVLCSQARTEPDTIPPDLLSWLRNHHRHGRSICALASGTWILAASGLLSKRRCSAHWTEIQALRSTFPDIDFTPGPFVETHRIWTCSGGDSVTDMILDYLSVEHGASIAAQVRRRILLKPAQRRGHQRDILIEEHSSDMEIIGEQMLDLIENNIETPLSIAQLSARLSVPRRSLHRVCERLFGCGPKTAYMNARMSHAKTLLVNTRMPIAEIALRCGFRTPAHFATAFKSDCRSTPGNFRKQCRQVRP